MTTETEIPLISAILLAGKHKIIDVLAAIECFKTQTYAYKELIIVNNAKTQFAASELNIQAERDIFLIDTPYYLPAGLARNYGISTANGRILAQFDADFWHHPQRLEAQVAAMANADAHISVLTRTLAYSYNSGVASYHQNKKQAILNTMVVIRPEKIDYPHTEKYEEFGFLSRLSAAGMQIVALDKPELACKLFLADEPMLEIQHSTVSDQHRKRLTRILADRHGLLRRPQPAPTTQKTEDAPTHSILSGVGS